MKGSNRARLELGREGGNHGHGFALLCFPVLQGGWRDHHHYYASQGRQNSVWRKKGKEWIGREGEEREKGKGGNGPYLHCRVGKAWNLMKKKADKTDDRTLMIKLGFSLLSIFLKKKKNCCEW